MNSAQAASIDHDPNKYVDPAMGDEVDEATRRAELLEALDGFGAKLSDCRSEAIDGRKSSGIEEQWEGDDEYYAGLDDANNRKTSAWGSKPLGQGGIAEVQVFGSRMFPNITRPYVDAAAARISDILQPVGDELSWAIKPTPVPELIDITSGKMPRHIATSLADLPPEQQQTEMAKAVQWAKDQMDASSDATKKAEREISDWLAECQYQDQKRMAREDMCRLGTGILKGPIPAIKKVVAYKDGQLLISDDVKPISVKVSPHNVYPDPACGEDIHNGSYIWERDDITYRKLSDLKGTPGYIDEQIDKCLSEKAFEATRITDNDRSGVVVRTNKYLFEIWHFYGMADKKDLITALQLTKKSQAVTEDGAPMDEADPFEGIDENEKVYIHLSMVNKHVIRMVMNPLDTGEFPYDFYTWQRIKDSPWGIGVARQARTGQDVVKAGWRNMMDNGGIASGPQVVFDPEHIRPHGGVYEFGPWTMWEIIKGFDGNQRLDDHFRFIQTPMYQAEMAAIIEMGNRLAEDATGLPLIMQGQSSAETPDTLGGLQLQNQNASTVLRRVARNTDATDERHIRRYYNFLLQYGEDDSAKGEFVIQAMGSSARVELEMNGQALTALYPMSQDPRTRVDPTKIATEIIKAHRIDPARVQFDDKEWEQISAKLAEQAQKGAGGSDTAVAVAQLREQGATARNDATLASKENIEERKIQAKAEQDQRNKDFDILVAQFDQDVIAYQEQMAKGINDDKLKASIAETVMKLRAQMQSDQQLLTPPTEPAGRAPDGQAFQR